MNFLTNPDRTEKPFKFTKASHKHNIIQYETDSFYYFDDTIFNA